MGLLCQIVGWILLLTVLFLLPLKLWCMVRKRRSSRVVNWVLLSAFLLLPIMSQSQYMFLNEPLVEAAREGDYRNVNFLLQMGAWVNGEADDGRGTALVAAIHENHPAIVRLLIQRGANVNQAADGYFYGRDKITPLECVQDFRKLASATRSAS